MNGYTALMLMRAKRERDEAELAAPHIAAAASARYLAHQEQKAREGLERILQSKLLPHVMEQVGRNLGEGVYREIMKAVTSQKSFTGTTTLKLPTDMLMAADPKSVVARVVEWWRSSVAPKMSVSAMTDIAESHVTTIDIRLPPMGYRERVFDNI